ncbi:hypothetical protein KQH41_02195, partial [bacterium]|nr:hypothetical protein [bacterium]
MILLGVRQHEIVPDLAERFLPAVYKNVFGGPDQENGQDTGPAKNCRLDSRSAVGMRERHFNVSQRVATEIGIDRTVALHGGYCLVESIQ